MIFSDNGYMLAYYNVLPLSEFCLCLVPLMDVSCGVQAFMSPAETLSADSVAGLRQRIELQQAAAAFQSYQTLTDAGETTTAYSLFQLCIFLRVLRLALTVLRLVRTLPCALPDLHRILPGLKKNCNYCFFLPIIYAFVFSDS